MDGGVWGDEYGWDGSGMVSRRMCGYQVEEIDISLLVELLVTLVQCSGKFVITK